MPTPISPALPIAQTLTPTPLPVPNRADPTDYATRMDTNLAWRAAENTERITQQGQINAAVARVNLNATEANQNAAESNASATTATAAATAAAASATAAQAIASATSVTSVVVGAGAKSLTLDAPGIALASGMWVRIANTAAPSTNVMRGVVTSYNSGTRALVVDVQGVLGSGTYTAWTVSPSTQLLAADLRTVNLDRPRAVPSLLVLADAIDAIGLPPGVTFARASTKMVRNDRNIWSSILVNAPPITHDVVTREKFLWIEDTATNYLLRSQDFSNASWTKTNCTITTTIASPDAGTNAQTVTITAGGAGFATQNTATMPAGPCTLSMRAKQGTTPWVFLELVLPSGGGTVQAWYNTSTGATGSTTGAALKGSRITQDGDGFWLCEAAVDLPSGGVVGASIGPCTGNSSTTSAAGLTATFWQMQCENYYHATSPVVTTSATVTRSADVLTDGGFGARLTGATGCTIVTTARSLNYIVTSPGWAVSRGPAIWFFGPNSSRILHYGTAVEVYAGTATSYTNIGAMAQGVHTHAVVIAASGAQSRYAQDGAAAANLNGTGLGALTTLNIGHNNNTAQFAGLIKELRVYPFALTDLNIQSLSALRP